MSFLKRFPESKHEQILQVISYVQMCGLSGRDLVSIGGWIHRSKTTAEYRVNKERVQAFIDQKTIRPIGSDPPEQVANRFKYKGLQGDYNFVNHHWGQWEVTSMRTKVRNSYRPKDRDWPGHVHWQTRCFYNCVLDIADDSSWLNF